MQVNDCHHQGIWMQYWPGFTLRVCWGELWSSGRKRSVESSAATWPAALGWTWLCITALHLRAHNLSLFSSPAWTLWKRELQTAALLFFCVLSWGDVLSNFHRSWFLKAETSNVFVLPKRCGITEAVSWSGTVPESLKGSLLKWFFWRNRQMCFWICHPELQSGPAIREMMLRKGVLLLKCTQSHQN